MTEPDVALMEHLVDEHGAVLWRFCRRLLPRDPSRAEDVAQETLLRAWRHRTILESPPPEVRAWLFKVARNIVIDQWRSPRTSRETSVADVPENGVGDETDRLLQSWVVAEALSHLSLEHRAVLHECYFCGRPVAEAATRLGVPEGTVKSRTHYALRALKLALEEMGMGA